MKSTRLFTLFSIALLVSACATNLAGRKQFLIVPENQAIRESKAAYIQMIGALEEEGKVDTDPAMVARVNRITDRLIVQAEKMYPKSAKWEWSVKVIDDPETINAWCMAGGRMAIYTGLILKLNATDDEIAQVMGHEISHALANHSAERMSIALATNLALISLQKSGSVSETGLGATALAAQVALTLPNSRTGESEADRIGIEIAARAGFDPAAAVTLWQKMARASSGGTPEFLSTHPSPNNREAALKKQIPRMMPLYLSARQ